MRNILFFVVLCSAVGSFAAPRPANKPFDWANDLKYGFLPRQKMVFINGVVKNKTATALPDIEAKYSKKVRVDGRSFSLPGEICENTSACYKADLNGDRVPDYIFVNIKVLNGRLAGSSDVAVFVSDPQKNYALNVLSARHLEAEVVGGKIMLIKYDFSDDEETYIRQFYRLEKNGRCRLHRVEPFTFKY